MTMADIAAVSQMEQRLFSSPWPRDSFRYELQENPYSHLFVAEDERGQLIGYAGVWTTFDQAQITTIGVDEPYRRQRWATRLMQRLFQVAQECGCEMISLEVRVSNLPAQTLYKKMGFETIHVRKSYYQDNHEDAYLMMRPLGGEL